MRPPVPTPLTGERTVPGVTEENYWFRRHEAAYEYLLPAVAGSDVLEVGCGEGYGTDLLAAHARRVVGVDYDAATVTHAAARYARPRFVRANLAALPVATGAVDVLVTLQVIEHVWDHGEFLAGCRRVLSAGGLLVVTTPNRLTFSPGATAADRPLNPFHTREFAGAELAELVSGFGFAVEPLVGLHAGRRLADLDARHGGSFVAAQLGTPPAGWSPGLRADVSSMSTADFEFGSDAVDASLDLVLFAHAT